MDCKKVEVVGCEMLGGVDMVQRLQWLIDVGLTRDRGVSSSIDRTKSARKLRDVRLMTCILR
jgi:hypothetical protein